MVKNDIGAAVAILEERLKANHSVAETITRQPNPDIERWEAAEVPAVITVFAEGHLKGAEAAVYLCSAPPAGAWMSEESRRRREDAACFLWPKNGRFELLCFNAGVPVIFCGHGLLASAALAAVTEGLPREIVSNNVSYATSMGADGRLWLSAPRIGTTATGHTGSRWFNPGPVASATAGGNSGYLILRWPAGFDLRALEPDLTAIAVESTRAVIATCATDDNVVLCRYFAPQYGKMEDSVTGSAAVILADYWRKTKLSVIQCSPRGGRIEVIMEDRHVAIGGNVHINGKNLCHIVSHQRKGAR